MLKGLNRAAMLAIIPLMAFAISRAGGKAGGPVPPPDTGTLAVANLRSESLTFIDLSAPAGSRVLALAGPPHELLVEGGRLYATLGRGQALVEVEPKAPGVLRSMRIEGEPHGLALSGDELLVTRDTANDMIVIDRASLSETARMATGHTPHTVAVAGADVFVTDSRDGALRRMRDSPATVPTGELPESVAVAGAFVVTADAGSGTLSVFRSPSLEPLGRLAVGREPVRVVALDSQRVIVSLNGEGRVAIVDLARMKVERRVDVLPRPDGLCLSPDRAFVAVVSNGSDAVQLFRTSDWRPAGLYETGDGPGACAWLP